MSPIAQQPLDLDRNFESLHVHGAYVTTFEKTTVDVRRSAATHGRLDHVARLAEFVEAPPQGLAPIIDAERNLIVIPDRGQGSPILWVFNLTDGQLIRKPELYGSLAGVPLQYANGKALVAVEEGESPDKPDGLTTLLLCDVAGDGWLLGGVNLPARLKAREQKRLNTVGGVLVPVQLRSNGDIIATSSEAWHDKMDVLHWRGAYGPGLP
ncbi:hypothetical protein EVJ58_g187 [Rhodofomes roseus]|uniref:Uncharacterized protein n=1 Tax=Rhodofomes roseus TaxID=34475 RepID=A0A4Y9Z8X0_9APHY|nr:hypothetical protein EVJ58_g187 [Rhodofomes roseus]